MVMKKDLEFFGRAIFLIGVISSIASAFIGIYASSKIIITTLVLLGLFVGIFSIHKEDDIGFLVAVIAMVVFGMAGIEITNAFGETAGIFLGLVFRNYTIFVAAAGFVVAKKVIFSSSEVRLKEIKKRK